MRSSADPVLKLSWPLHLAVWGFGRFRTQCEPSRPIEDHRMNGFNRDVATGEHNLPTCIVIGALIAAVVFLMIVGG